MSQLTDLLTIENAVLAAVAVEAILHFVVNAFPGERDSKLVSLIMGAARFLKRFATPGGIGRTVATKVNPKSKTAAEHDVDDFPLF